MTYAQKKEAARVAAIDWQNNFDENSYSYGDLADIQEQFVKLGRRYGLVQEFRENGII